MKTPEALQAVLQARWNRAWPDYLGNGGRWPLPASLAPPTERQAQARWPDFVAWIRGWTAHAGPGRVEWEARAWPRLGSQQVPVALTFKDAAELAIFCSAATGAHFARAQRRFQRCTARWPDLDAALRREAPMLAELDDVDFDRWVRVLDWLLTNLDCGLYLRQLPIEDVDSKWIEHRAGPFARLIAQVRRMASASLIEVAGLAREPILRRFRLLDGDLREQCGGLSDITVRLDEMAGLHLPVTCVLIVENQKTALACEDVPGTAVLMGGGFAAVALADVPWIAQSPVLYWGDLDVSGFEILSTLRQHLPHVQSCLMDEATLSHHLHLATPDPTRRGVPAMTGLTSDERQTLQLLVADPRWPRARLEQERLPWRYAWSRVERAIAALHDGGPSADGLTPSSRPTGAAQNMHNLEDVAIGSNRQTKAQARFQAVADKLGTGTDGIGDG